MAAIKISAFLGETPRTAERLLGGTQAQIAENVDLNSGEIRPINQLKKVYTPPVPGNYLSAYRATFEGAEKWRAWTMDVNVAATTMGYGSSQRYFWTGDGCPRYALYSEFGTTEYAVGLPAPTLKNTVTPSGGVSTVISRSYLYTFYNPDTGEESGPSPVSDITSGKVDDTWTIANFSNTPANTRAAAWRTANLKQRLYRTSGTVAQFQLVAERAVSTGSWADNITDAAMLGDDLLSNLWEPPLEDLKGLISLPNGCLVGFSGKTLCFSEPMQPHAWPAKHQFLTSYPIVGIEAYGNTVVIATTAYPYVASGNDPATVTLDDLKKIWPCLSKRSVCAVGDGVIFATKEGLAYIGSSGMDILTKSLFTQREWEPLNPASMACAHVNGRVYVRYQPDNENARTYIIDSKEAAQLTRLSLGPDAWYVDKENGGLYLVSDSVDAYNAETGARLLFNWTSREVEMPVPMNFGACRVEYDVGATLEQQIAEQAAYEADLAANEAAVAAGLMGTYNADSYNTYAINDLNLLPLRRPAGYLAIVLKNREGEFFSEEVLQSGSFRLPSGFKSDLFTVQIIGNVRVNSVKFAETMSGLREV